MCEQPEAQQQAHGDNGQPRKGCENCTQALSTQDQNNRSHTQHGETYYVPASQGPVTQDFHHRSMITIQSQQESPQEVWFHSPTQVVIYHPTLYMPQTAPQEAAAAKTTEPKTNGNGQEGPSA
ncbi:hypothetical protein FLONG3_1135 [Fusarium longipes]|uniref:Uncharacterized protein n=1 Tax=Fusarium longipes TaxID=694270 RepID=A0A395T7H4_9HYPO|nr:hypothetical protein FLONG3_1135 [Fusarium longipes]